jgi:hypothetical protein
VKPGELSFDRVQGLGLVPRQPCTRPAADGAAGRSIDATTRSGSQVVGDFAAGEVTAGKRRLVGDGGEQVE